MISLVNFSGMSHVCTFEFLISAHPNPKPTTLDIPLGGQPDKTRQLARQVGERIRDPLENSMAFFKFPSPVLPEGTTFVFGSWVCVANGAGGFSRHSIDDTICGRTNLNYSGSSTRVHSRGLQRASNGIIPWPVG
jgi:hypothetical protein